MLWKLLIVKESELNTYTYSMKKKLNGSERRLKVLYTLNSQNNKRSTITIDLLGLPYLEISLEKNSTQWNDLVLKDVNHLFLASNLQLTSLLPKDIPTSFLECLTEEEWMSWQMSFENLSRSSFRNSKVSKLFMRVMFGVIQEMSNITWEHLIKELMRMVSKSKSLFYQILVILRQSILYSKEEFDQSNIISEIKNEKRYVELLFTEMQHLQDKELSTKQCKCLNLITTRLVEQFISSSITKLGSQQLQRKIDLDSMHLIWQRVFKLQFSMWMLMMLSLLLKSVK